MSRRGVSSPSPTSLDDLRNRPPTLTVPAAVRPWTIGETSSGPFRAVAVEATSVRQEWSARNTNSARTTGKQARRSCVRSAQRCTPSSSKAIWVIAAGPDGHPGRAEEMACRGRDGPGPHTLPADPLLACVTCAQAKPVDGFYEVRGPAGQGDYRANRCIACCEQAVDQAATLTPPSVQERDPMGVARETSGRATALSLLTPPCLGRERSRWPSGGQFKPIVDRSSS